MNFNLTTLLTTLFKLKSKKTEFLKKFQKPRKPFIYRAFLLASPEGLEPSLMVPKTIVLSVTP